MKHQASMQGSASILIILIMISLSAFGVLSMMSAYSDYKLAQKNAAWTASCYALDAEAQRRVGLLNESLHAAGGGFPGGAPTAEAFREMALGVLPGSGWDLVSEDPFVVKCVVSRDKLHLNVELRLHPPENSPALYTVLSWRGAQDLFSYNQGQNIWSGVVEEE